MGLVSCDVERFCLCHVGIGTHLANNNEPCRLNMTVSNKKSKSSKLEEKQKTYKHDSSKPEAEHDDKRQTVISKMFF